MARAWHEHAEGMALAWREHGMRMVRAWGERAASMAVAWHWHGTSTARAWYCKWAAQPSSVNEWGVFRARSQAIASTPGHRRMGRNGLQCDVLRLVGGGAFAKVFLARTAHDKGECRRVVLKVPRDADVDSARA